jgi:hypothetical protein
MKRHATVAMALVLVGCNKSDDGPGVSLEAAPAEIAKAVCPKAYTCCTPMQLMGNDLAGTTESSCEIKTADGFKKNLDGLKGSINKGRVRYHGDLMADCLVLIRSSSCEQLNRTNHFSGIGCPAYVEALVAPGGACGSDAECIDGFCEKAMGAAEGTCRALPKQGESCVGIRCAKGFVCNGDTKQCEPEVAGRPGPPNQCFYSSACSYGRGPWSGGLLLGALGLLALAARRRRAVSVRA